MQGSAFEHLLVELAEQSRNRFYGKYRGVVSDIDDPDAMGRIRAKVAEVLGDEESPWALPCMPYAGDGMGIYAVPPVGAGVWIEFEAGDPARPIWTGCRWKKDQLPKNEEGTVASPPIKIIRTEKGMMVTINDDQQIISISDENGSNLLKIEVTSGKITVKSSTKAIVEAPAIELVENATHPVVFGDDLLNYLNQVVQMYQSHTHPGETVLGIPVTPAPPMPPLPTPMSTMLSTKVKSG